MMRWQPILVVLVLGACTVRPAFIPAPRKVFDHFVALPRPVHDLAVGALWIEGHGTYGAGAAPDNLETQAGISGVTIDNDLAASLSLGFLQYLDLDPTLQSKVTVRLNDVTLVRVKDMSALGEPVEQPRVYEALRAGSATITAMKDVGVAIEASASEHGLPVVGRGSSGRQSTFSIEAKDVYLAVRIATLQTVSSTPVRVRLGAKPESIEIDGLEVQVSSAASEDCRKGELGASKGRGVVVTPTEFDPRTAVSLELSAPIGARSSFFDHLSIQPDAARQHGCAVLIALTGTALSDQA